jgi:NADP-dependent aldehyde dehydrogenase
MEMTGAAVMGMGKHAGSFERPGESGFFAVNPMTGEKLEPKYGCASEAEVEMAAKLASQAAGPMAASSGEMRAELLRKIAEKLLSAQEAIVQRAHLETGLPLARLSGEMGRTVGQLRLFAEVAAEGSWVDARMDTALPNRTPMPRPAVRSMLRPLGPVVVFGASNFPLAFSVAGGDTAAALAAGCPVIVKAHPAHPGTSELVGWAICEAAKELGWPEGTFALLFDSGVAVGTALVQHPSVQAVAFTGSATGGQALMKLAAARPNPIPCFAEMGSSNPVFVLPGAMRARAAAIAGGLTASFTLGSGQFCTKPGVVFVPKATPESFWEPLRTAVGGMAPMGMLTAGIAARFQQGVSERKRSAHAVETVAEAACGDENAAAAGAPTLMKTSLEHFLAMPELEEEIFGPTMLVIEYAAVEELAAVAGKLQGHLTATIHAEQADGENAASLLAALERRVGRVVWNSYPTGVEVCHAMVHGGPFPATSDSRFTSVGTASILRFARPVCFQDVPDEWLPKELQSSNALGIERMVDGRRTRESLEHESEIGAKRG